MFIASERSSCVSVPDGTAWMARRNGRVMHLLLAGEGQRRPEDGLLDIPRRADKGRGFRDRPPCTMHGGSLPAKRDYAETGTESSVRALFAGRSSICAKCFSVRAA